MGLTIHYSLKADGSESKARKLIHLLHQAAQDLPFTSVGELAELSQLTPGSKNFRPLGFTDS